MLGINERRRLSKVLTVTGLLLAISLVILIYPPASEAKARKKFKQHKNPHFCLTEVYIDYFRVKPSLIETLAERIIYEEIPVVLFISQRTKTNPDILLNWRLGGANWLDISLRLGLSPDIYYVPIPRQARVGPPFGNAYGYYRKRVPKARYITLSNEDIINLVLLRVVSDYFGLEPFRVIQWRSAGKGFDQIIIELRRKKD
ncbi:MAG: hypothetical protein A3G93_13485 [Nitrospinae bacterium RIFCSPLOWO2_12_FULL_45_22]|nr:MAG: hypothetical protein A3G93_13485 [Nitrospinae bacterium RIFCSPLOWO2_12_FULL_45_22]